MAQQCGDPSQPTHGSWACWAFPKLSGQKNSETEFGQNWRRLLNISGQSRRGDTQATLATHKRHGPKHARGGTQATPHRCDAHGALRGRVPVRVMSRFLAAVGAHCAHSPSYIRAIVWKLWEFKTFLGGAAFRPSTLFSLPQLKSLFFGDPDPKRSCWDLYLN